MTKKEEFLGILRNPGEFTHMSVSVTVPDCTAPESISNPLENFLGKAAYYEKAYDDELQLKACPTIRIVAYYFNNDDCTAMYNRSFGKFV